MSAKLPVLVGIDGSRDGLVALIWAASYATLQHAPLHVLHVMDEYLHKPSVTPLWPDDGSQVLEEARDELERLGFTDASLEVRHGHPANVLLELAEEAQALVVGRRGLGGFAELVLGSTSQVCTALSTDIPLIVVPDTWDPACPPHGRIVVGVDGSAEGQEALRFGFQLAAATNAELHGVHAIEVRESNQDPWIDPNDCSPQAVGRVRLRQPWADEADELLAQTLDGWAAKYPEVPVRQRGVTDHPVLVLAHESKSADLIVVGGVGRTAFSDLRLGPVARGLLHHSTCPVAVVHAG
ncbi:universal stress protein [Kribbella sp. NPDC026611]|uniref:universal stress protein n=1 Tax=Kribbella sp. NPDC026611 TaxID=3154911 RepID=UPI0033DCD406